MYPVRLEDDSVRLREFESTDLDAMASYAGDPEVMGWIATGGVSDRASTQAYLDNLMSAARAPSRARFELAVESRELGSLVGAVRMSINSREHARGDIGYLVAREHWGKGYATQAARLIVRFGFEQLWLHRIFAHVRPDNAASIRVLEKAGLSLEGRLRRHMRMHDGSWRDSLLYAVVRDS